jgi:hypothetical protein
VAVILHDGEPPAGGREACLAALDALGEREHFTAARDALAKLTDAASAGWATVRRAREELATLGHDRRRRPDAAASLERLTRQLADAGPLCDGVRRALAGLIDGLWIERYLSERLTPLRAERDDLARRIGES